MYLKPFNMGVTQHSVVMRGNSKSLLIMDIHTYIIHNTYNLKVYYGTLNDLTMMR